jgi:hypothetical protein
MSKPSGLKLSGKGKAPPKSLRRGPSDLASGSAAGAGAAGGDSIDDFLKQKKLEMDSKKNMRGKGGLKLSSTGGVRKPPSLKANSSLKLSSKKKPGLKR